MPSSNTYHLTWVSLTLDVGYLFTAAPEKRKKIRDTKGTFHAKMGSIKDKNGMDLKEQKI